MISVIVPTFNRAKKLRVAIQSILNQHIESLEIIVVDDNSIDNTEQTILAFDSPQIKYIRNNSNKGTTCSRVLGLKQSLGEYIAFLDDDDIWIENKLSQQLDCLLSKNVDFVLSNYIINDTIIDKKYKKNLFSYEKKFALNIVCLPGPFLQCCLFKRSLLIENLVLFDSRAEPSEDWDFFIGLSKLNPKVAIINDVLFQWNRSIISQSDDYFAECLAHEYILSKHKDYIIKVGNYKTLAFLYRKLGSMYFYIKNYTLSKKYFSFAYLYYPWSLKNVCFKLVHHLPSKIYFYCMSRIIKKIV